MFTKSEQTSLPSHEHKVRLISMDIISIGICRMIYACMNWNYINSQRAHIAVLLPPFPFLQDEAHYLSMVCRGRLNSVFAVCWIFWKKNIRFQCMNSILEKKLHCQQMNAYEFMQLVVGAEKNKKYDYSEAHSSLKEPILNVLLIHLHSTYWHCLSIKCILMAAWIRLLFLQLSGMKIMKHFQQE